MNVSDLDLNGIYLFTVNSQDSMVYTVLDL